MSKPAIPVDAGPIAKEKIINLKRELAEAEAALLDALPLIPLHLDMPMKHVAAITRARARKGER